jgi:hypothetical protein
LGKAMRIMTLWEDDYYETSYQQHKKGPSGRGRAEAMTAGVAGEKS